MEWLHLCFASWIEDTTQSLRHVMKGVGRILPSQRVCHAVLDRCKQRRDRRLKRVRSQSLVEPCWVSPPLVKSSLRGQLLLTGEWLSSLFATVILIVATKECDEYSIVTIITAYLSWYTFRFISKNTYNMEVSKMVWNLNFFLLPNSTCSAVFVLLFL